MKNNATDWILLLVLVVSGLIIYGCQTNKTYISFSDANMSFNIVGYAKQAPFSPDPNLYCYLAVEPQGFISDQIDNVVVFRKISGELCLVYKTANQEHILVSGGNTEDRTKINFKEELFDLESKVIDLKKFEIEVLDRRINIHDIRCVLFNWDSSGIQISSLKTYKEGIRGSYNYNIRSNIETDKSGIAVFTEWDKNDENWPEIRELRFPLKN
jgi:hypothetical protein